MVGYSFAQTAEQRKEITKDYDQKKLTELAEGFSKKFESEYSKALDYAKFHRLPSVFTDEKGATSQLMRMDEHGNLLYRKTMNVDAGITIGADKLHPGGGMGLELTGAGITAGIWDGGRALLSHELLADRIILKDGSPNFGDHATHVAGTMIGAKLNGTTSSKAKGMAYEAELNSYDWFDDLSEMTNEASNGMLVSNHSYGLNLGAVNLPMMYLGVYNDYSSASDALAYSAPYYSIVTAAGNDRDENYNPADNGYNLLGAEFTTAKNTIVVAAVEKVLDYTGPSSVVMSYFSSWGPTKDNRVKPDISADGVLVISAIQTGNTAYGYMSGTSMASPGVSGGIILLQDLASELNQGKYLKSSTIKALIVQTARQADEVPGPNPRYGWGLMNVADAAQLMINSHENSGSYYEEVDLNNNASYTKKIVYSGEGELKATIAWTDPAAPGQNFGNTNPVLVNDLDLRIKDSSGNTYYPWRLANSYDAPPLNDGDNVVDNVEQVVVSNPVQGEEYTITVIHKGSLVNGHQEFGIAVSGSEPLSVNSHELKGVMIYPNPASDIVNISLENSYDQVEVTIYDLTGKKVMKQTLNKELLKVDTSKLNTGVYFMEISSEGKQATKKLVIK